MTDISSIDSVGRRKAVARRLVAGPVVGGHQTYREVIDIDGSRITLPPSSGDAFGRLRVSSPQTIFDSKLIHDAQPLLWDDAQVSGTATSTHSAAKASVTLGVSANTAGRRVRQSRRRIPYQPGKSQLVFMTGVFGGDADLTGLTKMAGLFDDEDGVAFRLDANGAQWGIRSSASGVTGEEWQGQSVWNMDTLDGSGDDANPSGIALDHGAPQILLIDFEWLGVGTVRVGFVIDGALVYVHDFHHANLPGDGVYMSTPNLPVRYELENDGSGAASSLQVICSTVISEGGQERSGLTRTVDRAASGLVTLNDADLYPLIALRLQSTKLDATVRAVAASVFCTSASVFRWALLLNPTVAGTALSFSALANSAVEADVARTNATKVSGGTLLASGYQETTSQSSVPATGPTDYALGASIAGVSDILVLAVQRLTGSTETFYGTLTFTDQV